MREATLASDRDICAITVGSNIFNISTTHYSDCVDPLIPMASDTRTATGLRGSAIVVAIVVPAFFVLVVLSLIVAYGANAELADPRG
jgi:hypothetical protein